MINNTNHQSPLPLSQESTPFTSKEDQIPLEAIGGHVGALGELMVEMEAPTTWAMVEGNGTDVESNVSCLLS